MQQKKKYLKEKFVTGAKPQQKDFHDWMDSYVHKEELEEAFERLKDISLDPDQAWRVDGELDGGSRQPVENRAVAAEVEKIQEELARVEEEARNRQSGNTINVGRPKGGGYHTLESAVGEVAVERRKPGLCVTWMSGKDKWESRQYVGTDISQWMNGDLWAVHGGVGREQVAELVKGNAGCFYYDETASKYYVFADDEAKDKYLEDPSGNPSLLLATIEAGAAHYTMKVEYEGETYKVVEKGSTGNVVSFKFGTQQQDGSVVSEGADIQYIIENGSVRKSISTTAAAGSAVNFDVSTYLGEGINTVTVALVGKTSKATGLLTVTYNVQYLEFESDFDISTEIAEGSGARLYIPWTMRGNGTKHVAVTIDGVPMQEIAEDVVTVKEMIYTKVVDISKLTAGAHYYTAYAYVIDTATSTKYATPILLRGFFVTGGTLAKDYFQYTVSADGVASSTNVVKTEGQSLNTVFEMLGISQFEQMKMKLCLKHKPTVASNTTMDVYCTEEDAIRKGMDTAIDTVYDISVIPTIPSAGFELKFTISTPTGYISIIHVKASIAASNIAIKEITENLSLNLEANGRTNDDADRDTWKYGDISATFSGFMYNVVDGWVDAETEDGAGRRLVLPAGRVVGIPYNPFASAASTGATLEADFSTSKDSLAEVSVISVMNGGAGIEITSSKATITTRSGKTCSCWYKPGDDVRLSFVAYPLSGVPSDYQGLILIYMNGVISAGVKYIAGDGFDTADIRISGKDTSTVKVKQIRAYTTALSEDQVVNNYIMYQDSVSKRLEIYYRNDVQTNGILSAQKISAMLPIFKITGDYHVIDNTTDKKTNILVDAEYTNNEDASKNFTATDLYLRGQGTSSMFYPVKNLRPNFTKGGATLLYDAEGNLVADSLYAHKKYSQRVNEYTLKTDFAESSGTHNAGVARLWSDCLYNAQIEITDTISAKVAEYDGHTMPQGKGYYLRTEAQTVAAKNKYKYDVRTTVDGFPIVVFVRENESDEYTFHGKYNFLNDKSTESVFGFRFPDGEAWAEDFNRTHPRMQCWEFLDSTQELALFKPGQDFGAMWKKSWEGRYPDGSTDTADLETLYAWLSSVSQEDFKREKWEHFDVMKVAAYYVYLMRQGGVDQTVKNAMFQTEDGKIWFFINYDNDTVDGVKNDGALVFGPYIDRQSIDTTETSLSYAYAGHESRLWNLLEADECFMKVIVPLVDQALINAKGEYNGYGYKSVIEVFNKLQADKWCEKIYNEDARIKYIQNPTYLSSMQGNRTGHRKWWISTRWAFFDSKWETGNYRANNIVLKCNGNTNGEDFKIKITAGLRGHYGYGINSVAFAHTGELMRDEAHEFAYNPGTQFQIGNPISIYASYAVKCLDVSSLFPYLSSIDVDNAVSDIIGTQLEELVIGPSVYGNQTNTSATVEAINNLYRLKVLNIRGLTKQTSIDVGELHSLEQLLAGGSGLCNVSLPVGGVLKTLELPSTMTSLIIESQTVITWDNITFGGRKGLVGGTSLSGVSIRKCPELARDFDEFAAWAKTSVAKSLTLTDIDWTLTVGQTESLVNDIGKLTLDLRGAVRLPDDITAEQIDKIQEIWGTDAFTTGARLQFVFDGGVIIGSSEMGCWEEPVELLFVSTTIEKVSFAIGEGDGTIVPIEGVMGATYTPKWKASSEEQDTSVVIMATAMVEGTPRRFFKTIVVHNCTWPKTVAVKGDAFLVGTGTQTHNHIEMSNTPRGNAVKGMEWTLDEDAALFADIEGSSDTSCCLLSKEYEGDVTSGVLKHTIIYTTDNGGTTKTIESSLIINYDNGIIVASGLCGDNLYWTLTMNGTRLTITGTGPSYNYVSNYATAGVRWNDYLTKIKICELGNGITVIGDGLFRGLSKLEQDIVIPESVVEIRDSAFYGSNILVIDIPDNVLKITGDNAFAKLAIGEKRPGVTLKHLSKNIHELKLSNFNGNFYQCKDIKKDFDPYFFDRIEAGDGCFDLGTLGASARFYKFEAEFFFRALKGTFNCGYFYPAPALVRLGATCDVVKLNNSAFTVRFQDTGMVTISNGQFSSPGSGPGQTSSLGDTQYKMVLPPTVTTIKKDALRYLKPLMELWITSKNLPTCEIGSISNFANGKFYIPNTADKSLLEDESQGWKEWIEGKNITVETYQRLNIAIVNMEIEETSEGKLQAAPSKFYVRTGEDTIARLYKYDEGTIEFGFGSVNPNGLIGWEVIEDNDDHTDYRFYAKDGLQDTTKVLDDIEFDFIAKII